MNIKQLRFVQAVASSSSFSKAAELCHVTQPTLSNAIAQLETEFDNKIFERTTRSVSLTPFGLHVLPLIERSISDLDELGAAAHAWKNPDKKLIRLGLSPVVDMRLLQAILAPYRDAHTDVEFYYKECYLNDLEQRLKLQQLDIILIPPNVAGHTHDKTHLYQEPLCYVPCRGGRFEQVDAPVTLSDVSSEVLVLTTDACGLRSVTIDIFEQNKIKIKNYPGQATTYSVVEDWADLGIGAGILPQSKISPASDLSTSLLVGPGETAYIGCEAVWTQDTAAQDHVSSLIEHFRTLTSNIVAEYSRPHGKRRCRE